jgi:hypothetical protein
METSWRQFCGRAIVAVASLGLLVGAGVTVDRFASSDEPQVGELVLARDAEDRQPGSG